MTCRHAGQHVAPPIRMNIRIWPHVLHKYISKIIIVLFSSPWKKSIHEEISVHLWTKITTNYLQHRTETTRRIIPRWMCQYIYKITTITKRGERREHACSHAASRAPVSIIPIWIIAEHIIILSRPIIYKLYAMLLIHDVSVDTAGGGSGGRIITQLHASHCNKNDANPII